MNTMIEIINNFFSLDELDFLNKEIEMGNWNLSGTSYSLEESTQNPHHPKFWYKNIFHTQATSLFTKKLQTGLGYNVVVDRIYVNGQAHGQSGVWHIDVPRGSLNCFTAVYFFHEWPPEFGGHLLIKTDPVTSIIPEFNKAVIFNSAVEHVGLEPTSHCKTQRESIACKFRVLV